QRGFKRWISLQPMPMSSSVPVELFSIATSAQASRRFKVARPSAFFAFTPKLFLLREDDANDADISEPMITRMKSGYVRDSTFTTSAPYSTSMRPASTPTPPMPKSSTRRPASGADGAGDAPRGAGFGEGGAPSSDW